MFYLNWEGKIRDKIFIFKWSVHALCALCLLACFFFTLLLPFDGCGREWCSRWTLNRGFLFFVSNFFFSESVVWLYAYCGIIYHPYGKYAYKHWNESHIVWIYCSTQIFSANAWINLLNFPDSFGKTEKNGYLYEFVLFSFFPDDEWMINFVFLICTSLMQINQPEKKWSA